MSQKGTADLAMTHSKISENIIAMCGKPWENTDPKEWNMLTKENKN